MRFYFFFINFFLRSKKQILILNVFFISLYFKEIIKFNLDLNFNKHKKEKKFIYKILKRLSKINI